MSVRKHVVLLVGPKGAGKSTLGALAAARLGAADVEPEALWIAHTRAYAGPRDAAFERAGFERVVAAVAEALVDHDLVVTDTTAASAETPAFVDALRPLSRVSIVRIDAAAPTCLSRIQQRDESRRSRRARSGTSRAARSARLSYWRVQT